MQSHMLGVEGVWCPDRHKTAPVNEVEYEAAERCYNQDRHRC